MYVSINYTRPVIDGAFGILKICFPGLHRSSDTLPIDRKKCGKTSFLPSQVLPAKLGLSINSVTLISPHSIDSYL